jgi:hypothetical protein
VADCFADGGLSLGQERASAPGHSHCGHPARRFKVGAPRASPASFLARPVHVRLTGTSSHHCIAKSGFYFSLVLFVIACIFHFFFPFPVGTVDCAILDSALIIWRLEPSVRCILIKQLRYRVSACGCARYAAQHCITSTAYQIGPESTQNY